MTTLLDVRVGDQFIMVLRCTARNAVTGLTFNQYTANRVAAGELIMAPLGAQSGQLAAAPDQIPVTLITGFTPLQIGDVMQRNDTGETLVVRQTSIKPDGTMQWSASVTGGNAVYNTDGWSVVGHVNLDG